MSTLWIFGDSFASAYSFHYKTINNTNMPDWVWMQQVKKNLRVDSAKYISMPGVSNEWLQCAIRESVKEFSPGDYVVIVTTHINRRWLIKDRPELSNIYLHNLDKVIPRRDAKIIKNYYETFLDQHLFLSKIYQEQFLTWCYAFAHETKIKLCLLPAFDETPSHTVMFKDNNSTCLTKIDEAEFAMEKNIAFNLWGRTDRRLCHLSESNHTVLAQKIVRYFRYNEKIDLMSGFQTNCFKDKNDIINYRPKDV